MVLKKNKDPKLYFSIGEVAAMFKLKESTLRFWEKQFGTIRPRTNAKGVRFYKKEDIEDIRLIHYLVREQKLTLAGAREKLKNNKDATVRQEEIVHKLKTIKAELLSLKAAFDTIYPNLNPSTTEEGR
ncbi:MAG: MerR family transcriptional regulator [Tannerellaceae bacterium]|jgi:DNA-binding transcriptional MerR regulator|nr:MerR family transcriptional regulator [Tannerellaceae bacterium]